MSYNLTGLENNTNILEFVKVVNTASGEWFVIGLLLTLWVILFIAFKNYETETAIRSASFIVSIIAILFFIIGMISTSKMMIPIIITGLTVLYGFMKN